jgi:hypothetical protein
MIWLTGKVWQVHGFLSWFAVKSIDRVSLLTRLLSLSFSHQRTAQAFWYWIRIWILPILAINDQNHNKFASTVYCCLKFVWHSQPPCTVQHNDLISSTKSGLFVWLNSAMWSSVSPMKAARGLQFTCTQRFLRVYCDVSQWSVQMGQRHQVGGARTGLQTISSLGRTIRSNPTQDRGKPLFIGSQDCLLPWDRTIKRLSSPSICARDEMLSSPMDSTHVSNHSKNGQGKDCKTMLEILASHTAWNVHFLFTANELWLIHGFVPNRSDLCGYSVLKMLTKFNVPHRSQRKLGQLCFSMG